MHFVQDVTKCDNASPSAGCIYAPENGKCNPFLMRETIRQTDSGRERCCDREAVDVVVFGFLDGRGKFVCVCVQRATGNPKKPKQLQVRRHALTTGFQLLLRALLLIFISARIAELGGAPCDSGAT